MTWIRIDAGDNVRLFNLALVQGVVFNTLTKQLTITFVNPASDISIVDNNARYARWLQHILGPGTVNITDTP